MDPLHALDRSSQALVVMVSGIRPDQWDASTPCTDWDVRTLVGHLIATMNGYCHLLEGAPAAKLLDEMSRQSEAGGNDPVAALHTAVAEMHTAFTAPGALERPVAH